MDGVPVISEVTMVYLVGDEPGEVVKGRFSGLAVFVAAHICSTTLSLVLRDPESMAMVATSSSTAVGSM